MRRLANYHRALLIATGVATTFGSAAVLAEEGASKRRIEEVIVTAERREASIQDTSISITAFDGDFLDDFGIRNQEDLQNFIPATTIQPYDATIRGVGRNFRALGGDPGVSTYINSVYSEDLLTATAQTFWDVERIEVLRGPQGTLYGRNAIGGAINIMYKEPTDEFEASAKTIVGDFGTQEFYGAVSGPIIKNKLAGRLNYSSRDRDGIVDELGPSDDVDGLGTENVALQLRWNPTDRLEFQVRQNVLDSDRSFGGADGGGLVVLNEGGQASRDTTNLVPGFREIDPNQTTNPLASDFFDASREVLSFTDPQTGRQLQAQHARAGIDFVDADGFQNAAASMTGFNQTSDADAAELNNCVFDGSIDGDDLCAGTNGQNREEFKQRGTQFSASWDVNERLQLKYIYGYNTLMYERTTDDDNTHSQFHDRQFYVNHEATYYSHELQAFYDISDDISVTSGIFFYDAVIDQRGDYSSTLDERRFIDPYVDNTSLSAGAAAAIGAPGLTGISATNLAFGGAPMPTLFSAKQACQVDNPAPSCARNFAVENPNSELLPQGERNDNLVTGLWQGDPGTDPDLDVNHGPNTLGSDLLYATKTERDSFALYTQGVWDINPDFSLTLGIRYAEDEVTAEENLFRYSETGGAPGDFLDLFGGVAAVNLANGGLIDNGDGTFTPTRKATNGGVPFGLSVYRPFERSDEEWTGRINLDWNINPTDMMYFSVTSGYRSGGYNLVFFSETADYDPEELVSYEIGYKTRWLDETLQVNGSFYFYDYETIHTTAAEVAAIGGNTISVVEAPGAEVLGAEGEIVWFPSDNLTLGGNFSFTPSEYTEDKFIADPSRVETPSSLFPNNITAQTENINGNQLLQVPEVKYTAYASYMVPLQRYGSLEFFTTYSYTGEVYYSPFERDEEKADDYDRTDIRASWYSPEKSWTVTAFVNNVFDEVGVLQVLREDEAEFFRHTAGITSPRLWGLEVSYKTGNY